MDRSKNSGNPPVRILHSLRRPHEFFGRVRSLRFAHGRLPVRVGVLEEDHVAYAHTLGAAHRRAVAKRGRRFEETQLRLKELLLIALGSARPKDVAAIAGCVWRQGVDHALPGLKLPVVGAAEGEIYFQSPLRWIDALESRAYLEHGDALVYPRPPDVGQVPLEVRGLVDNLVEDRTAVSAFAAIEEDATVEDGVHP